MAPDEPALRRLVDPRFIRVLSNGSTYGMEELIQGVLRLRMSRQSLRERSALVEGNFAVVIGTADIWFAQAEGPGKLSTLRSSSTYIKRDGQWRMLSLHLAQRT
ncbi:MAG: nuclear transport factor 2 family protein [Betaproteobacteria bacterium]|nr:nuclear transport factor 2 family protein [Betaproteobacteria bacterium]